MSYNELIEKYKNDTSVILSVSESAVSTNDTAFSIAECGKISIAAAESQTKGRGRFTRAFSSEKGGIYISFCAEADSDIAWSLGITPLAAVCAGNAIKETTDVVTEIKWPNDLLISGKKLCGILCEMREKNGRRFIIVGIGVNVNNELPLSLPDAVSISAVTGKKWDIGKIAAAIAEKICRLMRSDDKERAKLRQEYTEKCINLGKYVTAIRNNSVIEGIAIGINDIGGLVIRTEAGEKIELISGEATLRKKR